MTELGSNFYKLALVGGDEEKFNKLLCQQTTANGQVYHFQGHQLWQKFRRSNKHNAFVTDQRDVSAIRVELVMSLLNFMSERLPETEFSTLQPLQKLNANISDDELRRCHSALLSDMPLKDFVCAYKEAAKSIEQQDLTVRQLLVKTLKNQQWKCLSIALARVIAAKPHSADVERLISSYNCLKTNVRSSLSSDSLHAYLYIRQNMPPLANWDPRPSVHAWLHEKNRRPDQTHSLATVQEYFKGIFN